MRKFAAKNFHKPCNLVTPLSTFNSRSLKSLEQRRVNSSRPTALALLPPWCLHRVVAVQCDQRLKLKVAKKIKSCPKKSKVAQKVTIIASLKSVISQYSPKGHHTYGPLYHQEVFKKSPNLVTLSQSTTTTTIRCLHLERICRRKLEQDEEDWEGRKREKERSASKRTFNCFKTPPLHVHLLVERSA